MLVFIFQNTEVVEIKLWFWKVSMSRSLMILANLVVGVIVGWFLKRTLSKRKEARDLRPKDAPVSGKRFQAKE
jgi:uncharacterized integral membrane protein